MATTNEAIRDLAIRHQVGVLRLGSATLRKLIPILNRADQDIVEKLLSRGSTLEGSFTSKRLQSLLGAVREINRDAHRELGKNLRTELRQIARYEAEFQAQLLGRSLPIAWDIVSPSAEQLNAIVNARPFQGKLLGDWLSELEASRARRVRDAVRLGMVEGETVSQIVQRIRGTKALQYRDGAMQISRRGAEAMVRTAVAHTTSAAREELYQANANLIANEQWVATLDTRTCPTCGGLDGQKFELGKGPRAPIHIGCRCLRVPVTKSWRELGFDIDELPPGTRASMNGQVPATETFGSWLKKQPMDAQEEVLGVDKAALFRTGDLPIEKFSVGSEELTLDQLRQREAAAFERAGLNNPIRPPRGTPQDEIARFLTDEAAQRELLTRLMGDLDDHIQHVERAIERNGWTIRTEPGLGIRHYTGSSYHGLNARLRAGESLLEDRQVQALIAEGVETLPAHRGEIWRAPRARLADADRIWDAARIGAPLDLGNQLQSFSTERNIARTWARDGNLVLHIKQPPVGAFIEELSQNPGEQEVLLPPGLRYKIVNRYVAEDGVRVLELEILEND